MRSETVYTALLILAYLFIGNSANAQCGTWLESPEKGNLENQHMFYRDAIKAKDYAKAYDLWKEVYTAAPAADGKRPHHYVDGRTLIKDKYASEADESAKEELFATFVKLYDEEYACYPKDKKGKDKKAYLLENKVYELYYTFNHDRDVIFEVLEEAAEVSGTDFGYSIIYPYADIAVNFFNDKKLDADKARSIHKYLNEVCDKQIASNEKFKSYYQQQKDLANQRFEVIGGDIFGCAFHVEKIRHEYDANPNDKENYTRIYDLLESYGCGSDEPLMNEIYQKLKKDRDQQIAANKAANKAAQDAQRDQMIANNPAYVATKAYKSGDYDTAIAKYNEAIGSETDASKQSEYHYYLAVIYGRKLKKYSKAKEHIKKSTSLNSSFGKPWLLLGDLYAKSSRSCGSNGFEQRMVILAAVAKWQKAKSVDSDPEVQASAQKNINSYAGQLPEKDEVFMNGHKVGGSFRVGCWIGETVTIRAK